MDSDHEEEDDSCSCAGASCSWEAGHEVASHNDWVVVVVGIDDSVAVPWRQPDVSCGPLLEIT